MNRFDHRKRQAKLGNSQRSGLFRLKNRHSSGLGFTLLELLVVLVMIGVIAAIAVPSWLAFLDTQRLGVAQNQVVEVLRQAQNTARQQHITYQASFRQTNDRAQWSVHPTTANKANLSWSNLEEGVRIEDKETTFFKDKDIYRIQFNHNGEVNGQLGRVTLSPTSGGSSKRCIFVSNLLGATRTGENHSNQKGNPCD